MATSLSKSGATACGPPKLWATKQDWVVHKARIEELYRGKTLPEVIQTMERQYGFKATTKMYKFRMKQWGLAKNHREGEMRAAIRKHKQRADSGKASALRIRGATVQYEEVIHYFKRKHVKVEDILVQRQESLTPEVVKCLTPIPSPISAPIALAMPEQILHTLRNYYYGSFEAGTWVVTNPLEFSYSARTDTPYTTPAYDLYRSIAAACFLFDKGLSQEAGKTLLDATACIKEVLLIESPGLLSSTFAIILETWNRGKCEIALAILRVLSDFSQVVLGEQHPLRRIFTSLAFLNIFQLQELATKASESGSDYLEDILGAMHIATVGSRQLYLEVICQYHQKESSIWNLLQKCKNILGERDIRTVGVCLVLARCLLAKGRVLEFTQVCQVICERIVTPSSMPDITRFRTYGLYLLACSQHEMQEKDWVELYLKDATYLHIFAPRSQETEAGAYLALLKEWWERSVLGAMDGVGKK